MPNGKVSLGYLRMQAQQRSDLENNPAVSTSEWNGYLSSSYKELYDKLVGAYGNDYYISLPYQFSLNGSQFYNLPDGSTNFLINSAAAPAFYKLSGVDLQYSGSPSGWVSLRNFEFISRNKYAYPNLNANINGYTNLRYRIVGNQLMLIPIPATSQLAQIWYVPEPTSLQYAPTCALTSSSATITVSDTGGLSIGMSVYALSGIADGTTISSINTSNNTVVLSLAATATLPITTVLFWTDAVQIDGISGWEEYVIVDAAIKANIKQDNPIEGLTLQLQKMNERINAMAEARDQGQAFHVSDALSINGGGYDSDDDFGGGGGFGWGGY